MQAKMEDFFHDYQRDLTGECNGLLEQYIDKVSIQQISVSMIEKVCAATTSVLQKLNRTTLSDLLEYERERNTMRPNGDRLDLNAKEITDLKEDLQKILACKAFLVGVKEAPDLNYTLMAYGLRWIPNLLQMGACICCTVYPFIEDKESRISLFNPIVFSVAASVGLAQINKKCSLPSYTTVQEINAVKGDKLDEIVLCIGKINNFIHQLQYSSEQIYVQYRQSGSIIKKEFELNCINDDLGNGEQADARITVQTLFSKMVQSVFDAVGQGKED